jgi:hypothetical protein
MENEMPKDDLSNNIKVQGWVEAFPDQAFARELCQFIEDYGVVGPGVIGIHVVEGLEGLAEILRDMGWGNDQ